MGLLVYLDDYRKVWHWGTLLCRACCMGWDGFVHKDCAVRDIQCPHCEQTGHARVVSLGPLGHLKIGRGQNARRL